jgi:hypothetical protein
MMSQSVDGLLLRREPARRQRPGWIREVARGPPRHRHRGDDRHRRHPHGGAAMRDGADHFVTKPVNMAELEVFLRRSLELGGLRRASAAVQRQARRAAPFFGESPAALSLGRAGAPALHHDAPGPAAGRDGTGKGVLARFIHEHGTRDGMPFVEISCAGCRATCWPASCSATRGARSRRRSLRRRGCWTWPDGGTLFLDEIGDLDAPVQSQFSPSWRASATGGWARRRERRSEFRLICATSRVLTDEVAAGRFRPDLYSASTSCPSPARRCANARATCRGLARTCWGWGRRGRGLAGRAVPSCRRTLAGQHPRAEPRAGARADAGAAGALERDALRLAGGVPRVRPPPLRPTRGPGPPSSRPCATTGGTSRSSTRARPVAGHAVSAAQAGAGSLRRRILGRRRALHLRSRTGQHPANRELAPRPSRTRRTAPWGPAPAGTQLRRTGRPLSASAASWILQAGAAWRYTRQSFPTPSSTRERPGRERLAFLRDHHLEGRQHLGVQL